MFITRKIGKILRGKSTPLHLMMAAVLGAMIGFVPGFWEAPGLLIALLLLLIVLNANFAAAGITALLAKLASYPLLPVSFAAGQFLLDGPTQPLFKWLINAPVFALFGFEHYLTTGAALVGLIFGVACGVALIKIVTAFRRKMSTLEENSEAFVRYTSKGWVKAVAFIFVGGGKGKFTYAQLLEKKFGNPIRVPGAIFAALVVVLLVILQTFLSGPILTAYLHRGLERVNGATVDLGHAEVDLRAGRMTIERLAMADPNALETDLLRAAKVEAAINTTDLLRKRARIDRVIVSEAISGEKRAAPGRRVGPPPQPLPPPPGEEKTIDDYIADAQLWKERLAQVRQWLEKLSGEKDETEAQRRESAKERIARQIRESGYSRVKADHLLEHSPTLVIGELIAEGVRATRLDGEILDIRGENLSTHPRLLAEKPRVNVKSRSDRILLLADLAEGSAGAGGENANQLQFRFRELPTDWLSQSLAIRGNPSPISGGTMDIEMHGQWASAGIGYIDLPLNVTLNNTTVTLPTSKVAPTEVKRMPLALGLKGPMDNPRVLVDEKKLADAFAAAGANALASHMRGEAQKRLDDAAAKAGDSITGKIEESIGDRAKGILGNLPLPGKKE